jgi:hypothetical protein
MDVQTLSLPRLLTKTRRLADRQPERVEGVYIQEQSFGVTLHGPVSERNAIPAGTVLAESTCTACNEAAAATTFFVP